MCRKTPWSLGPILQITGYVNRLSVGRHISRVGFSYFSWVSLLRHYISVFLVCTFVYIGPKLLCFSLALFLVLRYFVLCLSCLLLVCFLLPSLPSLFTSHLFWAVVLSSTGRKKHEIIGCCSGVCVCLRQKLCQASLSSCRFHSRRRHTGWSLSLWRVWTWQGRDVLKREVMGTLEELSNGTAPRAGVLCLQSSVNTEQCLPPSQTST